MSGAPRTDDVLSPEERALGERLNVARPVPAAAFRGTLGRRLASRDPGYGPRPERLVLMIAGWVIAGLVLLAIGAAVALS